MCMDVFGRKLSRLPLLLAALSYLGAAHAQNGDAEEILFSFGNFSYVGNTSRADVTDLEISQGDLKVQADKGSANRFDFERSEWRLEGNVRIAIGSVRIAGDVAQFSARNNRLEHFELEGHPATFEDLEPHNSGRARGAAERLTYDSVDAVIGLRGEAELAVGQNVVLGCDLIYDIAEETFRSGSTECDRPFRIRIVPSDDASGEAAP